MLSHRDRRFARKLPRGKNLSAVPFVGIYTHFRSHYREFYDRAFVTFLRVKLPAEMCSALPVTANTEIDTRAEGRSIAPTSGRVL